MINLNYQFQLLQAIRNFFLKEGFLDVLTPPIVQNPGMETHIHPFKVNSIYKENKSQEDLFLHTSPEFCMKELLTSSEFEKIFTLTYCFRDEPNSPVHRNQFIMLEWYRAHTHYEKIMDDVEELIRFSSNYFLERKIETKLKIENFERATISELFREFLGLEILEFLDKKELKKKIASDYKDVPLPSVECEWDDYYFLLFLNKIEPALVNYPYILLKEFPAPLSALSTISQKDERVCERFEVYLKGIELCNCFNELTNPLEQKNRFHKQKEEKSRIYNYELPEPKNFYKSLDRGLPESAGIALGVERLLYSLIDIKNPFYK